MSEHPVYDVAIVGYGPTGVTAANLLGQAGLNVLVVERDPDIYARARAISTDEEVLRIWQQVGLADRLDADMLEGGTVAFVDAAGRPFSEVQAVSHGCGHAPQQFIYQPAMEQVLRDGVDRFPNVEVRSGHECLRLIQNPDDVTLMLADLETDSFVRERARYVIAADGGSSPTRGQLGIGYEGRTFGERWVVIDTEVLQEWPGHDRLRFHCNPARPTVDCPTPLGHHRWEFPVRDGEDEKELSTDAAIWRILRGQGITERNVKILRAVVYSHHVRFADRWRVGRIFLAGDSAHAMPPWIGQGMSAGVRDAANLCWKLEAVLRGSLPESVLDTYQTERMPHVREVTRRAVNTGRLIVERRPWVATMRNHTMRALSKIPGFTDFAIEHLWIPEAHYPKGFRSGGKGAALGRQIPQPWVTAAGQDRPQRLDDILGQQWTILHLGPRRPQPSWDAGGVRSLEIRPPGSASGGGLVDAAGTLTTWMHDHDADVLAVRPDGFVYAAGSSGHLPAPPPGLRVHPHTTNHMIGEDA
ncbi:bifunctional 3-(3-hydroxy-phenyl)propionate/3-hydroxycinnamic acid hydroxylase [Rhodococcus sp. NPDC003348]